MYACFCKLHIYRFIYISFEYFIQIITLAVLFAIIVRKPAKEGDDLKIELIEYQIETFQNDILKRGKKIQKKIILPPAESQKEEKAKITLQDFSLLKVIQQSLFLIIIIVLLTITIYTMGDNRLYLQNESLRKTLSGRIINSSDSAISSVRFLYNKSIFKIKKIY